MARVHFTGPLFVGERTPPGVTAPRIVARFGGTHGATTLAGSVPTVWVAPTATVTSSGRLPYGVYDGVRASNDSNRGAFVAPRILCADFIPATKVANLLSASASPGTAALTLATANVAGANTPTSPALTLVTDATGTIRRRLDCPRAVTITSGSDDSGIAFTVVGYDEYGVRMTETITGASGAPGTSTGAKAFLDIISITPTSTGAVGTTTAGTADVYGLPYRLDRFAYAEILVSNLLLLTAVVTPAVTTTPATATTGDVRGTFTLTADGTKTCQIFQTLPQASNPDITALFGTTQV